MVFIVRQIDAVVRAYEYTVGTDKQGIAPHLDESSIAVKHHHGLCTAAIKYEKSVLRIDGDPDCLAKFQAGRDLDTGIIRLVYELATTNNVIRRHE
jgi:hypothetical protein